MVWNPIELVTAEELEKLNALLTDSGSSSNILRGIFSGLYLFLVMVYNTKGALLEQLQVYEDLYTQLSSCITTVTLCPNMKEAYYNMASDVSSIRSNIAVLSDSFVEFNVKFQSLLEVIQYISTKDIEIKEPS